MKRIKQYIYGIALLLGLGGAVLTAVPAGAINVFQNCTGPNNSTAVCANRSDSAPSQVKTVINVLLILLGIMAVIVIIIGGIMYTTSSGDSGRVKAAKDTVLYAVVGLIVAMLSYAIVNFVIDKF